MTAKEVSQPVAKKLPTSLRSLSEQLAAAAKADPEAGIKPLGRPHTFSASPARIKVFLERNIRPVNWDVVEEYKKAFIRGDRFPAVDVVIENGEIVLKHGYHRTLAAKAAMKSCPELSDLELTMTEFKGNSVDGIFLMLNSQNSLDIDPVSRAEAYLKLVHQNMTNSKIAARLGKSSEHVAQQLILVGAEESVKALIRANRIMPTTVIELIKEQKQGGRNHVEVVEEMVAKAEAEGKEKATPKHRSAPVNPAAPKLKMKAVRTSLSSLVGISDNLRTALSASGDAAGDVNLTLPSDKVAELLALLDMQAATSGAETAGEAQ